MNIDPHNPESVQGLEGDIQQPQAISLDEAADIASEVQELVRAGRESSAWELIRHLHPADMGEHRSEPSPRKHGSQSASCRRKRSRGC